MDMSLASKPRRWSATALVFSLIAAVTIIVPATPAQAATEVEPFSKVYDETVWGDYVLFGNSTGRCLNENDPDVDDVDGDTNTSESLADVLAIGQNHIDGCEAAANSTSTSVQPNDGHWLTHADVDSDTGTFNSTGATIHIPPGASVKKAILYWGGAAAGATDYSGLFSNDPYNLTAPYPWCQSAYVARNFDNGQYASSGPYVSAALMDVRMAATAPSGSMGRMLLNIGTSGYQTIAADDTWQGPTGFTGFLYQSHADITSLVDTQVTAQGATGVDLEFVGANVMTGTGPGCNAGWSLALVYGYDTQDLTNAPGLRNVQIFEGFVEVDASSAPFATSLDVIIDPLATGDPRFGMVTYEGDQPISGDYLTMGGTNLTEPKLGGTTNFFASTVDPHYTVGGSNPDNPAFIDRNPGFINTNGYDSKVLELGPSIAPPGTTSLPVVFGTNGDRYSNGMFIFSFPLGPRIGAAKDIASGPTSNGDGSFDITYRYVVENYGGTVMHDVQLDEDLSGLGKLEASKVAVDEAREYSVNDVRIDDNVSDALVLNGGFNGSSDWAVFDGDTGSLNIDEFVTVEIDATFFPAYRNGSYTYLNQVQASGDDPTANDGTPDYVTTDLSDWGSDPDPDGDRQPYEDGENDPTGFTLTSPLLEIQKTSDAPLTGLLPGESFEYTIVVTNNDGVAQSAFSVVDPLPAGVGYVASSTSVIAYGDADDYADNFESGGYTGSSGTLSWPTNWTEINDDTSPSGGAVSISSDGGDLALEVAGSNRGVAREVDLSSFAEAQLTLDYRRSSLEDFDEFVSVEVSPDGGATWVELDRFAGQADDAGYSTESYDLTPYRASNTQIRFISSTPMDPDDSVFFDDVSVSVFDGVLDTYANAPAAPNQLDDGDAPNLVTPADPFLVPPGGTMTITFDARVDDPIAGGLPTLTNEATVSNAYQSPISDDVTNSVIQADLSLTKSVSDSSPHVGDTVMFTIVVTNDGPETANDVAVEDVLPTGFTYVPSSITGIGADDSASPTFTWDIGTLTASQSRTLTLQAVVLAPTGPADEHRNVAQVTDTDKGDVDSSPNNDDGDQSEDDEDFAIPVPQVSDLSLTKAPSNATPNVGEQITYTVTLTNDGPTTATNVTVEDLLPSGYTYVASTIAGGNSTDDTGLPTLEWTVNSLASGASTDLTFDVIVVAPSVTPNHYVNTAQVTDSDQYDPDSTPNNDDGDQSEDDETNASVAPQIVDLSLTKTVDDGLPNVGDTVRFTVTVENDGLDNATGVDVEDVVPAGYSAITAVSNSGTVSGSTITWTGLSVSASGSIDLTFDATVEAPTGAVDEYLNVAQVTGSDQYDPDSTPNNDDGDQSEDDEDNELVDPQIADLSLIKSVSDPFPVVGDTVLFTVVVNNAGPDAATNVSVVDMVPPGFGNITSISDSGSLVGSTITWAGLSIPSGSFEGLTFSADVLTPTYVADEYKNVAEVTASDQYDPDSTPSNDDGDQSEDDEDDATVFPEQADLSLVKTVNNTTPNVGDVVTFSIVVDNAGPDNATNVAVEDVVPGGYSSVTNISNGGSILGSTITWSGLSIANGGTLTLTFDATVDAPTATSGEYDNVAQVTDSDQHDPDSTPDNDDGTEDDQDDASTTPQVADLRVAKSVDVVTPDVGDTVTFTVAVTNDGPADASGVSVEDVVPAGYSNISSVSNSGSLSGSTITWSGLSIANDVTVSLTFEADVDAPTGVTDEYVNVAQVTASDQFDPDSTPDNDLLVEDDQDDAATTPTVIDLSLVKTVDDTSPLVGEVVTFTVAVANAGPADATGVSVADLVPSGYSSITNISDSGSLSGSTITWSGLAVGNGATLNLTFDATVDAPPASYVNIAQVTAANEWDVDSTPNNDDGDQSEDDEDTADLTPEEADLRLIKTVNTAFPQVGDTVTFTIAVSNDGPDDVAATEVEDVVPAGYSNITSISNGGSLSGSTITWSGLSVANGDTLNLTFDADIDAPTGAANEYVNVAQITASDQHDPDSTPDNDDGTEDDQDDASVDPQVADLTLAKSVDGATPNVGDTVTFTIDVTNDGPDDATGVAVEDVVPAGYSAITNISNSGLLAGSTITWSGLSIPNGATVSFTFEATVDAPTGTAGEYDNVAQVTNSDQHDPDSTPDNDLPAEDDQDSATVAPQQADLSVVKSVTDETPNVGDLVTFTVLVANAGPSGATGVSVEDVVPAGYSGITNISHAGSLSGSTITWSGLSIASGSSTTLMFQAIVDAPTGTSGEFDNVAQVTESDQYDPDSTPDNDLLAEDDQDDATTTPQVADLNLAKTVDDATPNVGDTVTFTVTVTNDGPSTATNVVIEDVVPAGYSGVTNISNGGTLSGSTITWNLASLGLGFPNRAELTFDAVVDAPTGTSGEYTNVAQVTDSDQHDPDSNPDNDVPTEDDQDDASTTPQVADLRVLKSVDVSTPDVGDTVTFTVAVTNDGPDDASGVSVEDVVPAGYSNIASISNGGSLSGSTITWSGLSVANGATVNLTFEADVDAPTGAANEYVNVAQVTASDQHDPDSTPDNDLLAEDDQDDAATSPRVIDLSLVKTVDDTSPLVGEVVTFTVAVTNAGPADASGLGVQDVVPDGFSGITNISDVGSLSGSTITWSGLAVANGATLNLTFDATVDAPPASYVNIAQVTAANEWDLDSTPNNDDGDQSEDDEDTADLTPEEADLRLAKTVNNPAASVGDTVTFTIVVANDGPDGATGVSIEDVVPAGYSAITNISNGGSLSGSTITWSGLSVANGDTLNLTFEADVDAPTGAANEYVNVAQITASDQHDPDSTPDNDVPTEDDFDTASVNPDEADLRLVKTVSNATPNVGDTVTFTIDVTNDGPDDATGVAVEDVVPAGYSNITNISNSGSLSGSTITWSGLSIANGATVNLTFEADVDAPTGATAEYVNVAQVTGSDQHDPDSTPDNDVPTEDDQDNASVTPQLSDLRLTKSVGDATPNVGDTVTFTITVTNDGPDSATNVTVEDVLPGGYTYSANSIGGGSSRNDALAPVLTWDIATLASGAGNAVQLTLDATVNAPTGTAGEFVNVAQVTVSDQHDPDSTPDNDDDTEDDQDDASTTPQVADLVLVKSVDVATPNVGDTVTFTVAVTNSGPDDATGVSVEDVVPSGYSAITNISDSGLLAGSAITWSGLSIANGATLSLTFDATVDAPTGTADEFVNVAQVTVSDQHDPDSTPDNDDDTEDDQDDASTTPQVADLSVVKSVSDTTPNVGDTVTFTVAVTNNGPDGASGVTVEDVVPTGYSVITNISDSGLLSGSTITWSGLSIANGDTVNLTFDADVDAPTGAANEFDNVAQVTDSDQHDPDSTPDNDDDTEDDQDDALTTPQVADLVLVKAVDDATPNVGDTVTFTITVRNNGPNTATNVSVEDVLPDGYTYVATSIAGGDSRSEASAPVLTWTVNSLAVGAVNEVDLTFDAVVDAPTGTTDEFVNVAQVTDSDQHDPDSTPDNDDDTEDDQDDALTTPQVADLSLAKTVDDTTPNVGDTVTFTIVVSNGGPSDATGVSVEDVVPAGYSGVTNISSGGTMSGATITWTGLSVLASGTTTLTFDAVVDAPSGLSGEYDNVAQVTDSDQHDPDSTPDNDDDTEDDQDDASTTPQVADLSVVKAVNDATPNVGDAVTFTVAVTNNGPSDASGVSVEDVVPAGYSATTNISDAGSLAGSTIAWSALSIANGATLSLTFDATVDAPSGLSGEYDNVAQVTASDQHDPDSTPDNDDDTEDDQDDASTTPAIIGLAKAVSGVTNNGDATYGVSYLLTVENLGLVTITDLEIHDDIVTQFAAISPTDFSAADGSLTANGTWDGTAASNILAAGQSIDPGEAQTVQIAFTVTPGTDSGPHDNTATVDGTTPTGSVTDDSTDGVDPDPDDNGVPSEDDPTPVSFNEAPGVGAAKDLSTPPTSNSDGSFTLTFTILVENTGDVGIAGVRVREDLSATFAGADAWNVVSTSSSDLTISPSFDGISDTDVLDGTDALDVGASGSVDVVVSVTPGANLGVYWNSIAASGGSPAGTTVTDISQDGAEVDPDGDGSPTDNNDPTPVSFPGIGSVEGTIWNDVDADGALDPSEDGIAGATVSLVGPGSDGLFGTADDVVVATTVTDASGNYAFTDVPAGMYRTVVDPATLPAGMVATFDLDGTLDDMTEISVLAGEVTSDVDFGYVSGFNLILTKTANGDATIGGTLNYVLVLTNEGPAPTTGSVTVTDTVPSVLTIGSVDAAGWSCGVVGQTVDCDLVGDLAVGGTAYITITTTVGGSVGENIVNTATVTVDGPIDDMDLSDNTDSAATTIGELPHTGADLFGFALLGILLLGAGIVVFITTRRRDEDEEAQAA